MKKAQSRMKRDAALQGQRCGDIMCSIFVRIPEKLVRKLKQTMPLLQFWNVIVAIPLRTELLSGIVGLSETTMVPIDAKPNGLNDKSTYPVASATLINAFARRRLPTVGARNSDCRPENLKERSTRNCDTNH